MVIERLDITNGKYETKYNYFQVFSLRWEGDIPDGILKIISPNLKLKEIINPHTRFQLIKNAKQKYIPEYNDWQNIRFDNLEIVLVGWIHKREMQVKGQKIPRFSKNIQQYSETKVDNFGCSVKELHDLKNIKDI